MSENQLLSRAAVPCFPEKFRILSGSALKMIAMITMLIDHIGAIILYRYPPANVPVFELFGKTLSMYRLSRDIGRVAFPIFCFLLAEGFLHTHDRLKYGRNLLLFACISEIPWNFMHTNTWSYEKQNVFFTLFLGYVGICVIEYFRERQTVQILFLLALFWFSTVLKADYGWKGFIFILLLFALRERMAVQALVGSAWLHYEWKACFAFLSINMYNGKRGFIRGKWGKYFFYAFYPVHIIILTLICNRMGLM